VRIRTFVRRLFVRCGQIYCNSPTVRIRHPEYITIAVAALDNPALIQPTYHIYTESQLPWFVVDDVCDRYDQGKT